MVRIQIGQWLVSVGVLVVCVGLTACSEDNPGPPAKLEGAGGSFDFTGPGDKESKVRFAQEGPAKVWLHFDCLLTGGDFKLHGKVGFKIFKKTEPVAVEPVALTVTRDGVTADGLPRSRDGIVGLRERTFEGGQHLSGYAYLFDLPGTKDPIVITGGVMASGASCADGLGQYSKLHFTQ